MQQQTALTFTAALVMQEIHQTGTQGGQQAKIDVSYAGGRAKGKATTPSATGPKTVDVDAEMPAGAMDDTGIQPLVAAMRWAPGAKITVPVFASGKGTLVQYTLAVTGQEKVKVAAGEFDAFKVEMTGGEAPITLWVTSAKPHRVVKLAPGGMPLSIELAK
jgi:hypothetical protein